MYERRWGLIAGVAVAVILVGAIGWIVGRSSAPDASAGEGRGGAPQAAIRVIEGVPVGVHRSRAGALAAADNYVAVSSETVVQDPDRYVKLVRAVFAEAYQLTAMREAQALRRRSGPTLSNYEAGGRALAVVGARRLDEYSGDQAKVSTWTAGISWGPERRPGQRWFFTETELRWDGDRWRVERIDEADQGAPTPGVVRYAEKDTLEAEAFDRRLRGMTAPTYGAGSS